MLTFILKERLFFYFLTSSLRSSSSRNSFSHHVFFINLPCFVFQWHYAWFLIIFFMSFPTFPVVSYKMMTIYFFEKIFIVKLLNLFHKYLSMFESCQLDQIQIACGFRLTAFQSCLLLCFPEIIQDLGKNKIQNWKIYLAFINYFTPIVSRMPSNKEGVTYFPSQNNNFETEPRFYGSFHFK